MIAEIFKSVQEFVVGHIRWNFLNAQSMRFAGVLGRDLRLALKASDQNK
jgi:hypothetical protein